MSAIRQDFLESYDNESILAELRRLSDGGRTPLSRRKIDSHGRISSSLVIKRFGSLRAGLQAAGLNISRLNKASNAELCSIILELWTRTLEKNGRSPFRNELKKYGFNVSGDTYIRRFGSWNKALATAIKHSPDEIKTPAPQPQSRAYRNPISARKRFLIFRRDEFTCKLCRAKDVRIEVDHIIPVSRGGSDEDSNLQTLCFDCNRGKRNDNQ